MALVSVLPHLKLDTFALKKEEGAYKALLGVVKVRRGVPGWLGLSLWRWTGQGRRWLKAPAPVACPCRCIMVTYHITPHASHSTPGHLLQAL